MALSSEAEDKRLAGQLKDEAALLLKALVSAKQYTGTVQRLLAMQLSQELGRWAAGCGRRGHWVAGVWCGRKARRALRPAQCRLAPSHQRA